MLFSNQLTFRNLGGVYGFERKCTRVRCRDRSARQEII